MSVTFWVPAAGEEDAPDINFSNTNARDILTLIGEDVANGDIWGSWTPDRMPRVRRAIIRARAVESARSHLTVEPRESHVGSGGCRVIDCGNTDDQTLRRLNALEKVIIYAQRHGLDVHWG